MITNPSTHRSLWLGVGWVLAAWALWQGISYVASGNTHVHSPSLYVLAHEPGGMRTHGVMMIALDVGTYAAFVSGQRTAGGSSTDHFTDSAYVAVYDIGVMTGRTNPRKAD